MATVEMHIGFGAFMRTRVGLSDYRRVACVMGMPHRCSRSPASAEELAVPGQVRVIVSTL